jgi:type VI secretion system protein ImpC
LRVAKIEVVDVPGKPGCYRAVAFLKPHFQLDELTISLRLVADLPQGAK